MASTSPKEGHRTFTLFVVLPSEDVCTLRQLISGITVDEVKDRLELAAGIPSHLYVLVYPDGEYLFENQRLLIQENIHDGYLLKVQLMEHWEGLYQSVVRNNLEHVYHNGGVHLKGNILIGSDETGKVDHMVSDRGSSALFIASFHGFTKMCKMLLSVGVDVHGVTPFGRTALHACVCKDNIAITEILLEYGASPDKIDLHGVSPYSTACLHNSKRCVKRLRIMQLNLRGRKASSAKSSGEMDKAKLLHRPKVSSEISKITVSASLPPERPATVNGPAYSRNKSAMSMISTDSRDTGVYSHFTLGTPSKSKLSYLNLKMHKNLYGNLRVGFRSDAYSGSQMPKYLNYEKTLNGNTPIVQGKKVESSSVNKMEECESRTSPSPVRALQDIRLPTTSTSVSPDLHEIPEKGKTSDVSKSPQRYKKSVHFAAKERSCDNIKRSENVESLRRMKRRINIAANYTNKEDIEEKSGEAYKEWLKRKTKENVKFKQESTSSDETDDSDSSEDNSAFVEWLNKKKNGSNNIKRPYVRGGRPLPGLITIGSTEVGEARSPDPVNNIRSYKNWVEGRRRSQKRHNVDRMKTVESFMAQKRKLEEKRQKLLIAAVSYEEWMEHSEDRKNLIREILKADFEQLGIIEAEKIRKRAPKQITYTDWKDKLAKREENEKLKTELQIKYQQEKEKWRKEVLRSSRAISHEDWVKLKGNQHNKPESVPNDNVENPEADRVVYEKWLDTKHIEEINALQSQIQEERKVIENYQQRMANLISCQ